MQLLAGTNITKNYKNNSILKYARVFDFTKSHSKTLLMLRLNACYSKTKICFLNYNTKYKIDVLKIMLSQLLYFIIYQLCFAINFHDFI